MDNTPQEPDIIHEVGILPPVEDDIPRRSRTRWITAAVCVAVVAATALVISRADDPDAANSASSGLSEGVAQIGDASDDVGDDAASASDGDGTSDEASREDAMLAYAQCMRDNGVDMPDPQPIGDGDSAAFSPGAAGGAPGGPGGTDEEFEVANEACQSILDDAGMTREPPSAEEQAEMHDQRLQVAQCMRERGHDFPDPDPNGGPMGIAPGSQDDPQFRADLQECSEAAGMRSGGGGGGPDGNAG